jgi:hypothetical protein
MWADEVCIAGLDDDGNCVRPVIDGGVKQHHLFKQGRLAIYPRAKVEFELSPVEVVPPHIEDQTFRPESATNLGTCADREWEATLRSSSFPSVVDVFDGCLEGDRQVAPGAKTRSLVLVPGVFGIV